MKIVIAVVIVVVIGLVWLGGRRFGSGLSADESGVGAGMTALDSRFRGNDMTRR